MISFVAQKSGERLDKAITAHLGDQLSRSQIQSLIQSGDITVNGTPAKTAYKLKSGEQVVIILPTPDENAPLAENIPLNVVYEDAHLAVIDKPAGMIVHPGARGETGTLVNALLWRYPEIAEMQIDPRRAGIVHRLDKDTSGLILIAREDRTRRRLMEQFERRAVTKTYLALLERTPQALKGRIDALIGQDPHDSRRMAVYPGGEPAITDYEIIERFTSGHALARINLLTGRTHQIRVHMAHIGCPLVGDLLYGLPEQSTSLRRQFLHAAQLCFTHPHRGESLTFESPLPADLEFVVTGLRV